jgi:glutathionylspermidine synthase
MRSIFKLYPWEWLLADRFAAGLGIRESATPVTDNLSCFVPHLFE